MKTEKFIVEGEVSEGFSLLKEMFESNFKKNLETGAQLAVYVGGEKVVDLAGRMKEKSRGSKEVKIIDSENEFSSSTASQSSNKSSKRHQRPDLGTYSSRSIQVIHSTSKNATALVIAWLVQQGKISYTEKISTYWPEFGQNNKENITVAELLRHDAGLAFFTSERHHLRISDFDRPEEISSFLAAQKTIWNKYRGVSQGERFYHALTRGLYLNEIVKRVTEGSTIGQLLRQFCELPDLKEEGAQLAMGQLDEGEMHNLQHFAFRSIFHELRPKVLQNIFCGKEFRLSSFVHKSKKEKEKKESKIGDRSPRRSLLMLRRSKGKQEFGEDERSALSSSPQKHKSHRLAQPLSLLKSIRAVEGNLFHSYEEKYVHEFPSANLCTSAKSLAAFCNLCLFSKSENRILTNATVEEMLSGGVKKRDISLNMTTEFVNGGFCKFENGFKKVETIEGFYGWDGFGGSILAFDPDREIVICYIPLGYSLSNEVNIGHKRFECFFDALENILGPTA
eukprot:snap_masked-scaffold_1-processed-gene-30.51-mRNA-1 protein AED:1.00 eAED:1.00 QI:0/-1/0/0/-1/1/1/0/506